MKDEFGEDGLDILVNNVGTNLRKPSTEYTEEEYDALQATNQGSAFHLSAACFERCPSCARVPDMLREGGRGGAPIVSVPRATSGCVRWNTVR